MSASSLEAAESRSWRDSVSVVATVVVPTHNRAALLGRIVAALERECDERQFELVVVDDASTDGTWLELCRLCGETELPMKVIRLAENAGPAAARNAGWRNARAPVVLFTDDDCVPQPGWVAGMVDALATAGIVQGATRPDPAQLHLRGLFSETIEVTAPSKEYETCNMGYRTALLEKIGGFDERFRYSCEDIDLAWRARRSGATFAFVEPAVVFHDVRPSSFLARVRGTRRRSDLVLLVKIHPEFRRDMHRRVFWKRAHPRAILAFVGLLTASAPRVPVPVRVLGLAAVTPYVDLRTRMLPIEGTARDRVRGIPLTLGRDLAEVAVLAAASIRFRTLLL